MEYKKESDLHLYHNYKRCERRQNKKGKLNDKNKGSTIGGDYGYGFA
jgi:hypothetical protein